MINRLPRRGSYAVCPCCGQTLPPDGVPTGVKLSRLEMVIFSSVKKAGKHGIASDRLLGVMYDGDLGGGPLTAKNSMQVIIKRLNLKITPLGLKVRSERTGNRSPREYVLVAVAPTTHQR